MVSLPAIAEENDALGREPGEWLWSDDEYGYSNELRKVHAEYEAAGATRDWATLYQQRPRPLEGSLFKAGMISTTDAAPAGGATVRAWDLAATKQAGTRDPDWTVGVKMQRAPSGQFIVQDIKRVRGGPDEVEALIVNTAQQDGRGVRVGLPQDPCHGWDRSGVLHVSLLPPALLSTAHFPERHQHDVTGASHIAVGEPLRA